MKGTAFSLNWLRACLHELSLSKSFMTVRAVECILQWAFSVQNGPTGLYMRPKLDIPAAASRGRVTAETGWLTQSVRAIPC